MLMPRRAGPRAATTMSGGTTIAAAGGIPSQRLEASYAFGNGAPLHLSRLPANSHGNDICCTQGGAKGSRARMQTSVRRRDASFVIPQLIFSCQCKDVEIRTVEQASH